MKLPWIKFFVADWLSDEALRSCSVEARGLWADMICLMAKSDRHGYLLIGGKPARSEQLARICGLTAQRTSELMDELHASGVFSFDKETIISRRMVKDEQMRKSDASRKMRMRHGDVQKMSSECPTESPRQKLEARSQKLDNTRTQVRPVRADWIGYAKEIGWGACCWSHPQGCKTCECIDVCHWSASYRFWYLVFIRCNCTNTNWDGCWHANLVCTRTVSKYKNHNRGR